jgi:DNA-binding response OmpR family regulator
MPGMNGRDLARKIRADRPGIGYLYMSGYTDGIVSREKIENQGRFIRKPFTAAELAAKIRATLENPRGITL